MFTALTRLTARLRAFFRVGDLDRGFQQELDSHIAMLTEDNVRRGMSPEGRCATTDAYISTILPPVMRTFFWAMCGSVVPAKFRFAAYI